MKHTIQEKNSLPQYRGALSIDSFREILGFFFHEESVASLDSLLGTGLQPPRVNDKPEGEFKVVGGEILIVAKRGNPVIIRKYDDSRMRGIELRACIPEERKKRGRILEWYELSAEETRDHYDKAIKYEVLG